MPHTNFIKYLRFLPLFALPFAVCLLLPALEEAQRGVSADQVNLAMRRTADGLLRQSGDSTSRIPAVVQAKAGVWQVRLEQPFAYEQLPMLLQASFDVYGIQQPYEVAVRRCTDNTIDLGYHQLDFLETNAVSCGGREMPEGCHFLEVTFLKSGEKSLFWAWTGIFWLLFLGILGVRWYFLRQKNGPTAAVFVGEADYLGFGNSHLDVAGQLLICGNLRQGLTFRETKLLRLFVTSPDQLLERDFILQQVWADEGVLVGRSLDVFISRLRKKMAADPTVGIVAIHGVGYRLETGKLG
jgi:hypothetical protein